MLRPQDHEARLDRLVWDEDAGAARSMFPLVSPGWRALAEARLALAELEPGAERLLARVPSELQRDPGLVYERVRWRRRKDHYDDAIALHRKRAQAHRLTSTPGRSSARCCRAMRSRKASPPSPTASPSRHGLVTGRAFRRARIPRRLDGIALSSTSPSTAYDHFVRLYDGVKLPISVARGAYWAARARRGDGLSPARRGVVRDGGGADHDLLRPARRRPYRRSRRLAHRRAASRPRRCRGLQCAPTGEGDARTRRGRRRRLCRSRSCGI